jgi:WD40 repeat protein
LIQGVLLLVLFVEVLALLIRLPHRWNTVTVMGMGEGMVSDARFSPDGQRVLTSARHVRLWDAATGAGVLGLEPENARNPVFSPDGSAILVAGRETAEIRDAGSGEQVAILEGHTGLVRTARFSPDGTRVVTASADHTARVWEARTGSCLAVLSGHTAELRSAVFSPDGERVLTASSGMVTTFYANGRGGSSTSGHDSTARIWDAESGECLTVLQTDRGVYQAIYSPDGAKILTGTGLLTVWDARSGARLLALDVDNAFRGAFSPDGRYIAVGCPLGAIWVFDAGTGQRVAVLSGLLCSGASLVYSPDGDLIASGGDDLNNVRVWDARSGRCIGILSGHSEEVESVVFSRDGQRILTASWDGTARIWAP